MPKQLVTLENIYHNASFKSLPYFKAKKTQQITTLVLTFVTLSLFGVFAINPTLSTITNLKKQLSDNQYVNDKLTEKIVNLHILQEKYVALTDDLPIIEQAIPKTSQSPILLAEIRSLAKKSNITITSLQTFQIDLHTVKLSKNQFGSFSFAIQAIGSSENIQQFLLSLTKFDRIITFDTVSITPGTNSDPEPRVNVRGRAYFKTGI